MATAVCLIRMQPHYRHEAFRAGLQRLGFTVSQAPKVKPDNPDDVLCIWNRSPQYDPVAVRYERAGCRVIIAENGYLNARDEDGQQWFSLALGQHNGRGVWFMGGEDRWSQMGVELRPWRPQGGHLLVLPQRGIGAPGIAMPRDWINTIKQTLPRMTSRPVNVRIHPGLKSADPQDTELRAAWLGAHAVVTWGSGAALKAIAAGIPCFHFLPGWVGEQSSTFLPEYPRSLEAPKMDDDERLEMFRRLAWSQWRVREIENGDALAWLLFQKRLAA
jgi:hypothetical protein